MPFLVEFGAASSSRLSGTLPQDIGNLSKLTHLDLETNYLSGLLPTSFYNLTSLENISLLQNSFSGSLASSIGNFVLLKQMQLSMNQFTGIIPSDVARMTSLGTSSLAGSSMSLFFPIAHVSRIFSLYSEHLSGQQQFQWGYGKFLYC